MIRRWALMALSLVLAMSSLSFAASSSVSEDSEAVRTVQALGIMIGDEHGNLNLSSNVTRAEFAKMLTASSKYKDSISPDGSGYSLYSDVKSTHWASEYIRIAAEEGWMIGYTDGSFRPGNNITLEEACAAVLRLLGYSSESLAGSFPYAQLNKASALGLRDGIAREKGELMLRSDCALIFYNALSADNGDGRVYGQALGYQLTSDGKVDYNNVLAENLAGPYTASAGESLPFSAVTIYENGERISSAALSENDVYYYNAALKTLWIYTDRASGKISALTPSAAEPTSVSVAGKSYSIGTPAAVYKLSALSGNAEGNTVTLLLGMNGEVVDVLGGSSSLASDASYYGIVLSAEKGASSDKEARLTTNITLLSTDGSKRSFEANGSLSLKAGDLASVRVSSSGISASALSEKSISGRVSEDADSIGSHALAGDVRILDTAGKGETAGVSMRRSELKGLVLSSSDVRYYSENARGEIDELILNNVSGDTWSYGFMISSETSGNGFNQTGVYSFVSGGRAQSFRQAGTSFTISKGGFGYYTDGSGSIASMKQLTSVSITSLSDLSASSGSRSYALADEVEVYLKQDSDNYYSTELSAINASDYKLTGWIDGFSGPAGGKIRVIVAER